MTTKKQKPVTEELRMDAYYYHFDKTEVEIIDKILCAIASAGKAYHHTECWQDEIDPWENTEGKTCRQWIQNAANRAAEEIRALRKVAEAAKDWFSEYYCSENFKGSDLGEYYDRQRNRTDVLIKALKEAGYL